jgi:major type 1 subunit fimbrin (pilin)
MHRPKKFIAWMRLALLWLSALVFFPSHASAASLTCTPGGFTSFTLNMPGAIAVPRDLPNGSMLSAWASTPQEYYYTCIAVQSAQGINFSNTGIASGSATAYTVSYQGANINVFPTTLPGVGIALAVRPSYGCTTGAVMSMSYGNGCQTSGTTTFNFGGQVFAALVKTGDITPGTISGNVANANAWYLNPVVVTFGITPVNITVLTCQTPSKTIPMGTQKSTDFGSVGSTSLKATSFTLDINNCPAGAPDPSSPTGQINSIQYRIDPSAGFVNGFANVAALGGSPSAGGIGIQLYDGTGAVFPLGTNLNLAAFRPGAAASYSVPLSARYIRTGTVTAGPANTSMTVTINYQ